MENLIEKIVESERPARVTTHVRPDGDAYATSMGLVCILRALGVRAGYDPELRQWQGGMTDVLPPLAQDSLADVHNPLVVVVDVQPGQRQLHPDQCPTRGRGWVIDHHPAEDTPASWVVDTEAASCGQLLIPCLCMLQDGVKRTAAEWIAAAILADTCGLAGNFSARLFQDLKIVTALVGPARFAAIRDAVVAQDESTTRFQGRCLAEQTISSVKGMQVHSWATNNQIPSHCRAGLSNRLLDVRGAEFAFTVLPDAEDAPVWRIAFRSRPGARVTSKAAANAFGGGGHPCAGGGHLPKDQFPTAALAERAVLDWIEKEGR